MVSPLLEIYNIANIWDFILARNYFVFNGKLICIQILWTAIGPMQSPIMRKYLCATLKNI